MLVSFNQLQLSILLWVLGLLFKLLFLVTTKQVLLTTKQGLLIHNKASSAVETVTVYRVRVLLNFTKSDNNINEKLESLRVLADKDYYASSSHKGYGKANRNEVQHEYVKNH